MSSFEIIFPEVKHKQKILINQSPVIFEPKIQNKINHFYKTAGKLLIMYSKKTLVRFFALFGWF